MFSDVLAIAACALICIGIGIAAWWKPRHHEDEHAEEQ